MRRVLALAGLLLLACNAPFEQAGQESTLVEPTDVFIVHVESAVVSERTPFGSLWDPDGSPPDVSVTLECPPNQTRVSTQAVESLMPTWSGGLCTINARILLHDGLSFWVEDMDAVLSDVITPRVHVVPQDIELVKGEVVVKDVQALQRITLRFLRRD